MVLRSVMAYLEIPDSSNSRYLLLMLLIIFIIKASRKTFSMLPAALEKGLLVWLGIDTRDELASCHLCTRVDDGWGDIWGWGGSWGESFLKAWWVLWWMGGGDESSMQWKRE